METKFEKLWTEKFPDEKLPNIFTGHANLEKLVSVYDDKITELRKNLKQCEFIKLFLSNVLKTKPDKSTPRAKPRSLTLDGLNNNDVRVCMQNCHVKFCKGSMSMESPSETKVFKCESLNRAGGNRDQTNAGNTAVNTNSLDRGDLNARVNNTSSMNTANSKHWKNRSVNSSIECGDTDSNATAKSTNDKGKQHDTSSAVSCTGSHDDSLDITHIRKPIKRSAVIPSRPNKGNARCVSLIETAHIAQVNRPTSYIDDNNCTEIQRPFIHSPMTRPHSPINRYNTMSHALNRSSCELDFVNRPTGESVVSSTVRANFSGSQSGNIGSVEDISSNKPVPIPRKLKLRSLSYVPNKPDILTKQLDHVRIRQTFSDTSFPVKVSHCSDKMSVDAKELPSVHSRIHNFEQKFSDFGPELSETPKESIAEVDVEEYNDSLKRHSDDFYEVKHRLAFKDRALRQNRSRSDPFEEVEEEKPDDAKLSHKSDEHLAKPRVRPKIRRNDNMNIVLPSQDREDIKEEDDSMPVVAPKPQRRNFVRSTKGVEVEHNDTGRDEEDSNGGSLTVYNDVEEKPVINEPPPSHYENVQIFVVNDEIRFEVQNASDTQDKDEHRKRQSENASDFDGSDYSDSKSNSLERPKRTSSNSEDDTSSLEELLTYEGVSLNVALTENPTIQPRTSLEMVGSVDFEFSDSMYDSALSYYIYGDTDVMEDTQTALMETDVDSVSLNVTDDDKTMAVDPKHVATICNDDNDSGVSIDQSQSHDDISGNYQQKVVETDIDDPVPDDTIYSKPVTINEPSSRDVDIHTESEVINSAVADKPDDNQHSDDQPPELPEKFHSYKMPRRARHDYEEIKDFMVPVMDTLDPVQPTSPRPTSPRPNSLPVITDGKKRLKKRNAPKPTSLMTNDMSQQETKSEGGDSSDSEEAEANVKRLMSPEDKKLHQRYVVIKGILESEEAYVVCLDVILQYMNYMKSLEGVAKSTISQIAAFQHTPVPFIGADDVTTIFFNISKIYQIHKEFVTSMRERVNNWHPMQTVGDLFKILISRFPSFSEYIKHYQTSVDCIHRCSNENSAFGGLVSCIPIPNSEEKLSLEDMLFKPVQRIQRNTLVLHDLIKCTPPNHPDHSQLEKTLRLSKQNLGEFATNSQTANGKEDDRRLVRNSFVVELVGGTRKLRYMFLFTDLLVCTKHKLSSRNKCSFDVKWFIPLHELSVDRRIDSGDTKPERVNVEELKKKVSQMKVELRREMKHERASQKRWLNPGQKVIEKLKKKLEEQEAELVLASPNLPFKLFHKDHKGFTILMSCDYEREEWSEAIAQQKGRWPSEKCPTGLEVHNIIEQVKQLPKVNNIGSVLLKIDDDVWNGVLNVTIKKLHGVPETADTYCCLELDSFGHFFMKAKTKVCRASTQPEWDEDFELDLDGSQTLRILCYKVGTDGASDTVLGRSALELNKSWLTERFQLMNISMNEISLNISIRHTSAAMTMKRQPSCLKNGLFGVKITSVTRRERRDVPIIVTACAEEIERRGMDEVGIYRVSGVTSEVQRLKKSFEKNSRAAAANLDQCDINAVTSILKLYFRELPEPIFTEAQYSHFMTTMELKDPEAKERCMMALFHELPEANITVILYILKHLVKVSQSESTHKMNCNNLATVFGPNLLRPGVKEGAVPNLSVAELVTAGALEALVQTSVLLYFLRLYSEGKDLSKPPLTL